jgi:3-deoxy-manno-octulosonate cytidylyltransferase (CMP-KDO synthetase)
MARKNIVRTVAVIPARLGSTRLPRKVLADIAGKPLIQHVWERVRQSIRIHEIIIATDSEEIQEVAGSFGAEVIMTSPDCRSGTERIASVFDQLDGDLILNVQGDEPLIPPTLIDDLIAKWQAQPCDMITAVYQIPSHEELIDPTVVKVVRARNGFALYFSRTPIPYIRDVPQEEWVEKHVYWGQIGVYGYSRSILKSFFTFPDSELENSERLEQLRFLEAGKSIFTIETDYRSIDVDLPADLARVREIIWSTNKPEGRS